MSDIAVKCRPTAALRFAIHRLWPRWRGHYVFLAVRDTMPFPVVGRAYHEAWGYAFGEDGEPVLTLENRAAWTEFYGEIDFEAKTIEPFTASDVVGTSQSQRGIEPNHVTLCMATTTLGKWTQVLVFVNPGDAKRLVKKLFKVEDVRTSPAIKVLPQREAYRPPELLEHEGKTIYAGVDKAVFEALYHAGVVEDWAVRTPTGGYHYRTWQID